MLAASFFKASSANAQDFARNAHIRALLREETRRKFIPVRRSFLTVRGSGEGRENRPQLRCGNASVQSSTARFTPRRASQSVQQTGEGGAEANGRAHARGKSQTTEDQNPKDNAAQPRTLLVFDRLAFEICAPSARHEMRSPNIRPLALTRRRETFARVVAKSSSQNEA
jgi:hypothetical protein